MIIGVDLDDVLGDSFFALDQFHNDKYGTTIKREDHNSYDLPKIWNATPGQCRERMIEFNSSVNNDNIEPIPAAQKGLKKLSKKHKIKIITSRMEEFKDRTKKWLKKNFPDHDFEVYHANHYYGLNEHKKSHFCKKLGVDVLIDDCLEYAIECSDENIPVLLLDKPWNQSDELPKNVTRVKDWDEVLKKIRELEKA